MAISGEMAKTWVFERDRELKAGAESARAKVATEIGCYNLGQYYSDRLQSGQRGRNTNNVEKIHFCLENMP